MRKICLLLILLMTSTMMAQGKKMKGGILNQQAPEWKVDSWFNLPEGKETLTLADYKGKVIYLYFFQSWCPACLKFGFPTLKQLQDKYKDNKDVAFVAVQTVFEGHNTNTVETAKKIAKKFSLEIPFGQSGEKGKRSEIKKNYKAPGTPWTVIIGKNGEVKFNYFIIKPGEAEKLIDQELKAKVEENKKDEQKQVNNQQEK